MLTINLHKTNQVKNLMITDDMTNMKLPFVLCIFTIQKK